MTQATSAPPTLLPLRNPKKPTTPESSSSSSSFSSPSPSPRLHRFAASGFGQLFLLFFLVIDVATCTLLQRYTLVATNSVYLPTAAVFVAEAQKLLIAFGVSLIWEHGLEWTSFKEAILKELRVNRSETLLMSVPSVVYAVQNNLGYVALANLDPATFQVTIQFKIVTTALMMTLMLGERLTNQKWIAIFLLTAGVIAVNLENVIWENSNEENVATPSPHFDYVRAPSDPKNLNYFVGLSAVWAYCCCSAFASVFFERLLKQPSNGEQTSLWIKNIQIYFFGSIITGVIMLTRDWGNVTEKGMLNGFDLPVHVNVLFHSFGGVLVSLVMKYTDNIIRNFANGAAILLSTAGAVVFFHTQVGALFLAGTCIVCISVYIYKS